MRYVYLLPFLFLAACGAKSGSSSGAVAATSCKGIYYTTGSDGALQKWNQFAPVNSSECLTMNMPLSNWEKSSQKFTKHQVTCTPQPGFGSATLTAANNFYAYRDGNVQLDLDSSTGIYRRLITGQAQDGSPVFTRSEGCFYQRTGYGPNAQYGNQLLLDVTPSQWASTEVTAEMEIFRYTISGSNVAMVRFDNTATWDYTFCPYQSAPSQYCPDLDNGNIMFYPTLTAGQQATLLTNAILISADYNYATSSKSSFESAWSNPTGVETPQGAWIYGVVFQPDIPYYIDAAWHDYVTGARTNMPDTTSSTTQPICYQGSQTVTLSNGNSGKVYGEICYTNGVYTFTQN